MFNKYSNVSSSPDYNTLNMLLRINKSRYPLAITIVEFPDDVHFILL